MGKIYVDKGIEYEDWGDGLVVRGFVNENDSRTKLSIPPYVDKDVAPNLRPLKRCVVRIDAQAFKNATNLQIVEIPETVFLIGIEAFSGCVNVKEVLTYGHRPISTYYLNSSLKILNGAFQNCTNLKQVFLNRTDIGIGSDAFSDCIQLKTFCGKISSVKKGAFQNCNIDFLTFANHARLYDNSIDKSGVKELFFFDGDCDVTQKTLNWMRKSQLTIHCEENSKFVNLAYEGINVEVVRKEYVKKTHT